MASMLRTEMSFVNLNLVEERLNTVPRPGIERQLLCLSIVIGRCAPGHKHAIDARGTAEPLGRQESKPLAVGLERGLRVAVTHHLKGISEEEILTQKRTARQEVVFDMAAF